MDNALVFLSCIIFKITLQFYLDDGAFTVKVRSDRKDRKTLMDESNGYYP